MSPMVLLCPPLYFARRRKWVGFVVNGFFYAIGIALVAASLWRVVSAGTEVGMVLPLITIGVFYWLLCLAGVAFSRSTEKARSRAKAAPPAYVPAWKRYVRIAVLLVLLSPPIAFVLFLGFSSGRAKVQAADFCAQVLVGEPIEGMEARAQQRGLIVVPHAAVGTRRAEIIAIARGPYSAGCIVEHSDSRVVGKRTYSND